MRCPRLLPLDCSVVAAGDWYSAQSRGRRICYYVHKHFLWCPYRKCHSFKISDIQEDGLRISLSRLINVTIVPWLAK